MLIYIKYTNQYTKILPYTDIHNIIVNPLLIINIRKLATIIIAKNKTAALWSRYPVLPCESSTSSYNTINIITKDINPYTIPLPILL